MMRKKCLHNFSYCLLANMPARSWQSKNYAFSKEPIEAQVMRTARTLVRYCNGEDRASLKEKASAWFGKDQEHFVESWMHGVVGPCLRRLVTPRVNASLRRRMLQGAGRPHSATWDSTSFASSIGLALQKPRSLPMQIAKSGRPP